MVDTARWSDDTVVGNVYTNGMGGMDVCTCKVLVGGMACSAEGVTLFAVKGNSDGGVGREPTSQRAAGSYLKDGAVVRGDNLNGAGSGGQGVGRKEMLHGYRELSAKGVGTLEGIAASGEIKVTG